MNEKGYYVSNFFTGKHIGKLYWVRTKNGIIPIFTRIEQTKIEDFVGD